MRMGRVQQSVLKALRINGGNGEGMWFFDLARVVAFQLDMLIPDGPDRWTISNATLVSVRRSVATLADAGLVYSDLRGSNRRESTKCRLAVWLPDQVAPPSDPRKSIRGAEIRRAIVDLLRKSGPEMEHETLCNDVIKKFNVGFYDLPRFRVGMSQSIRRLEAEGSIVATRAATPKGRPRCLSVRLAGG